MKLCILGEHRWQLVEKEVAMYTIERMGEAGWTAEYECKTEFRAFINARTKCMATGHVYRVVNQDRDVECLITLDDCKRQFQAG